MNSSLPLINLLQSISEKHTEKTAFIINGATFSYSEFYQKVTEIALELNATSNQKKVLVITNNDLETYASIIAIWLTGNTYIPINSNETEERLRQALQIVNADLVLVSKSIDNTYFDELKQINTANLAPSNKSLPNIETNSNAIAYILFTSGTTGIPKGVPVSYQNLAAFVDSFLSLGYSFTPKDIFLQMADLTFDMSIIATLIPLCVGATIVTIDEDEMKYLATYKALEDQHISVLITAPSTLQLLKPFYSEINLEQLNYTFVGAEAFYETTAQQWQKCAPNSQIINLYGPSEGGILSTTYTWDKKTTNEYQGIVSIGKAVKNIDLHIVDQLGNLITDNQEGEAWISGKQVFDSYLDETMNTDKFGYLTLNGEKKKCFKTGDIVVRANENLFYCGRKDEQIKVQGKRIELTEIEHYANQITGKFKAKAINFKAAFGTNQIALFVDDKIDVVELSKHLEEHLPVYMLPSKIIGLTALPLNKNQKVDKQTLLTYLNNFT